MSHAEKRPFPAEVLNSSIVIDLTSDNEDVRPPKRQRSESYATPKIQAHSSPLAIHAVAKPSIINQGNTTTPSVNTLSVKQDVRDNTGKFAATTLPAKLSTARSTSSQSTSSKNDYQNRSASAPNGTHTLNGSNPYRKPNVTNGMKGLSLRPSPAPQVLSTSLNVSVIDLDTDSDRATKKLKKDEDGKRSVTSVKVFEKTVTSSTRFPAQDARPIRFDQTSAPPSRKPSTHNLSTSRSDLIQSRTPDNLSRPTNGVYSPKKTQVQVVLPPNPKEKASRRREIIDKLKHDPKYLDAYPEEVFSVVGVKPFENKDLTKEIYDKACQKKHQPPVDRSKILLDFGTAPKSLTTTSNASLIHPRKQTRSILNERFEHQSQAPLTFENHVNDRRINGKFQFVSDYIFSRKSQSKTQTPHPHRSCACESGICGQDCNCLFTKMISRVDDAEHTINVRTYQRHSQQRDLVLLSDALIEDSTHTARIFECGDFCRCSGQCINRVVQKGRSIPLQIFETGKYGFGVRSSVPIRRGQFVDIYLGEVITESEVSKREAAAEEDTPSYIMALDAFVDEKNVLFVDGENFGSVMRFVNHSCEPNCKTIPVVLPKGTKQIYYVAFFAVKDIPASTELTIDYDPDLHVEEDVEDDVVQCQCGSAKCRKRLWAPGKEKRRRKKRYLPSKDDD